MAGITVVLGLFPLALISIQYLGLLQICRWHAGPHRAELRVKRSTQLLGASGLRRRQAQSLSVTGIYSIIHSTSETNSINKLSSLIKLTTLTCMANVLLSFLKKLHDYLQYITHSEMVHMCNWVVFNTIKYQYIMRLEIIQQHSGLQNGLQKIFRSQERSEDAPCLSFLALTLP